MPRSKTPKRRDPGTGSVFERTVRTRQGKTITRYVATLELPPGPNGRRRKTIYGKSRQEALERLRAAELDLRRLGNLPTSDPTLTQWCDLWLTEYGKHLKPTVLPGYRSKIETWIKPHIGRHKLSRLTPDHVRLVHQAMRDAGKKPAHILGVHRVLSSVLDAAQGEDKCSRNVAKVAGGPGGGKSTARRALAVEQAVKVMEVAAREDTLGARWPVAFLTGKRRGERLGMRWSYLDLDAGTADVSWALATVPYGHGCGEACGKKAAWACPARHLLIPDDYEYLPLEGNMILQRPKSETSQRLVPLVGFVVDLLRQRHEQVLLERPGYTVDHDLVWCHPNGRPIRPEDDWRTWKALLAKAKVEDFTQHEIRHTTVTLLMELGVDPSVIKQIVGHSDVLTQEAYKHVSLDFARRALDSLGHVLALPSAAEAS